MHILHLHIQVIRAHVLELIYVYVYIVCVLMSICMFVYIFMYVLKQASDCIQDELSVYIKQECV